MKQPVLNIYVIWSHHIVIIENLTMQQWTFMNNEHLCDLKPSQCPDHLRFELEFSNKNFMENGKALFRAR